MSSQTDVAGTTHEVDPATSGAHEHDHVHTKHALIRLAAHQHHHIHVYELEADRLLNGHSHALPRGRMPWETVEVPMTP